MSDPMTARAFEVPAAVGRIRQRAIIVAAVGVAAMAGALLVSPARFFQSYLTAFIFWTSLSLGCLGLLMVHHLSGGAWGLVIRRLLEAGAKSLALMAVLFVPLLFGLRHVYQWAQPEAVARDPILQWKQQFLNVPFWTIRTFLYFGIWTGMAFLLAKWSTEQDREASANQIRRFSRFSGPGLVVFGLTLSLASIDWMMSVDPHWFSTIYGFIMIGGAGLSALTFVVLCLALLGGSEPLAGIVQPKHLHDLGKLIFAFVMLYAYFTFSQFLIVWSANLPEEIPWYIRRLSNGWQYVMLGLVLLHFALPFALLLSATVKHNLHSLTRIALLVFVMRIADIHFQVAPQFHEGAALTWVDLAAIAGVGGLWVVAFCALLKAHPLLPVNDPYFRQNVLAATHGSH
jgi:hypothetical protein